MLAWSSELQLLAIASSHSVDVFDFGRRERLPFSHGFLASASRPATSLAWLPSSTILVVGYADGDIALWNCRVRGKENVAAMDTDKPLECLVGSDVCEDELWVSTEPIEVFRAGTRREVTCLSFSPNARWHLLLSYEDKVRLMVRRYCAVGYDNGDLAVLGVDVARGANPSPLVTTVASRPAVYPAGIWEICWDPGLHFLALGGEDHEVRILTPADSRKSEEAGCSGGKSSAKRRAAGKSVTKNGADAASSQSLLAYCERILGGPCYPLSYCLV